MSTLKTRLALRNDAANVWVSVNPVLMPGEIGIENDTGYFKIGVKDVAWNDLPYANKFESTPVAAHYEATAAEGQLDTDAIAAALLAAGAEAKLDDIAIVKRLIAADKYSYTAYVYNGSAWAALDGNYSAENVYFSEDIPVTTPVGNVTLVDGRGEIPAEGKNLREVFGALWVAENTAPVVSIPEITLEIENEGAALTGEVGTSYEAPVATATISSFGNYEFGSKDVDGNLYEAADTNIVFSTLKVGEAATADALTESNSASLSDISAESATKSISYTGTAGTFTDSVQTQYFSASAIHGGSTQKAVSNLGNFVNEAGTTTVADYASAGRSIAGATINRTKVAFTATGYRAYFVGTYSELLTADQITGSFIRTNLQNKGAVATSTIELTPGADGAKCVLVAIPQGKGILSEAILTSSMDIDILSDYTTNKKTVQITDASGAEGTEFAYDVYWYQPYALTSDEVHSITIAKV